MADPVGMEELLGSMARQLLGRGQVEDDVIRETAARLSSLTRRLRAFSLELLEDTLPAIAFDPGHPAYRGTSRLPPEEVARLGGAGSTGYGAAGPGSAGPGAGPGSPGDAPARSPGGLPEAGPAAGGRPSPQAAGEPAPGPGAIPGGPQGAAATPGTAPAKPEVPWAAGQGRAFAQGPLSGLSALELVEALRRRQLGVEEAVRAVLEEIQQLQPSLNAFVTVLADRALAAAARRERQLADLLRRGEKPGPLFGVPVALKDVIDVAGVRTTAGSRLLADHVATRDAAVTRRLEAAGAILVGKTATHEFAFGATTDTPFHGPVHNPWDLGHSAGGSSGGSGAAVGAGIVPVALGTDTGGSIRIPAAACGVVGLKPTYGRVSRYGIVPLSWSLDHPGPLAGTVADSAAVLEAIAGPDPDDPAAAAVPAGAFLEAARAGAAGDLNGVRVGVLAAWARDRVHREVEIAFARAVETLAQLGAAVDEVPEADFPPAGALTLINRILALAEGGAYHAWRLERHAGQYSREVRLRFELGQFLLARDYLLAQRLRTEICRRVATLMARFDVLVAPTLPVPAPRLGQAVWHPEGAEPEAIAEALVRLNAPFNVTGQPVLSVPVGVGASGLPLAMQIAGRPWDEATVLRVGAAYEQARGTLPR